jgi:hypothetical protein
VLFKFFSIFCFHFIKNENLFFYFHQVKMTSHTKCRNKDCNETNPKNFYPNRRSCKACVIARVMQKSIESRSPLKEILKCKYCGEDRPTSDFVISKKTGKVMDKCINCKLGYSSPPSTPEKEEVKESFIENPTATKALEYLNYIPEPDLDLSRYMVLIDWLLPFIKNATKSDQRIMQAILSQTDWRRIYEENNIPTHPHLESKNGLPSD